MIEINLYGPFREVVGEKTVERPRSEGATVGSALRSLAEEYPALEDDLFEDGRLRGSINVMKNGRNIQQLDGGGTELDDGDRVSVTVALEGG